MSLYKYVRRLPGIAGALRMEAGDKNRFTRPGLQIESFPVINLPQVDTMPRDNSKPIHVPRKHALLRSRYPLVSQKTELQVRPISDYRLARKSGKRTTTASSSLRKPKERKEEPRVFQELYKISYPCFSGCARCAFSQCFGPVKVYVSQYKQPKKMFADEIKDKQGRKVIPRDRIREFRGLVYDKDTNSCYPPIPKGYTSIYLNTGRKRKIIY